MLALFITVETPGSDLDELGAGPAAGIILGVFFGVLIVAYVFFMPYFERKLIKKDPRMRLWHVPMGPLLRRENVKLYWPGRGEEYVKNYYEDAYGNVAAGTYDGRAARTTGLETAIDETAYDHSVSEKGDSSPGAKAPSDESAIDPAALPAEQKHRKAAYTHPYDRWIVPVKDLAWVNPKKLCNWFKFLLLRGVHMDCVSHDSVKVRTPPAVLPSW